MSEPSNTPEEIKFRSSDIGIVTARHEDMFKEHKARAAEEKAKNDKLRKKLLIILGALAALLLGALAVWWLVGILGRGEEISMTPEEIKSTVTTTYDKAFDKAMDFTVDEDSSDIGPTDESIDSATEVYNQAINEAGDNTLLTNELRLSQMALYIMTGERYEEIVRIGLEINPDELSVDDRKKYYNYLAEAYWMLGNQSESKRYYKLIFELSGGEQYGG